MAFCIFRIFIYIIFLLLLLFIIIILFFGNTLSPQLIDLWLAIYILGHTLISHN